MITKNATAVLKLYTRSASSAASAAILTKREDYYKQMNEADSTDVKPADWDTALPFESIPGPKPLPIFGNLFRFLPGGEFHEVPLHEFNLKLREKYGNIVALKGIIGQRDMYFLYDPKDMEKLFRNQGTWPIRYGLPSFTHYRTKTRKDVFQGVGGLLSVNGEEWAKLRGIINPILMQPRTAAQYVGSMDKVANELITNIDVLATRNTSGEMPEDFQNLLYKWALESIGVIGLDKHLGALKLDLAKDSPQQIYIDSVIQMFEYMYHLDVLPSAWKYFSTPTWKKYVVTLDILTNTVIKHIDETLEKLKNGTQNEKEQEMSVFQRLLKVDRKFAMTMVIDMMIAGIDTTGRTMAAALYFLAKHKDKQDVFRKEVMSLLPTKDTPITKEIIENAPYLKAIIKETTRIAPIATGNLRTTVRDVVIGGYQIPKGTDVITSNMCVSNLEEFVPKSKEFLPERWLRECSDSEISYKNMHPFVFLPFGFGPRSCIGKRLANLELEIGLLKIIRNFELNWPHPDIKFGAKLLYGIAGPLKIHVKPCDK